MCLHCRLLTKKSRHSVMFHQPSVHLTVYFIRTSNLIISAFFPRTNVDKVEQTLALVEAMHKLAQTGTILHLSIPDTGSLQTLNICVSPNHNLSIVHVNLDPFEVIFDSGLQLIRSISTTCLVLVQELLLELNQMKPLATFSFEAVSCEAQAEVAHNVIISIGINQRQCKPSTVLQTLDWSSAQVNSVLRRDWSPSKSPAPLHDLGVYGAQRAHFPDPTRFVCIRSELYPSCR